MEKGKWEKARAVIQKSIRKDSLNTVARYAFAHYFFNKQSPAFQIDSAYDQIMLAMKDFVQTSLKERDRMRKLPLDSALLLSFREQVDSAAFNRALNLNTEQGYIFFLEKFLLATERQRAMELRDEVAYLDALKTNQYEAFKNYLEKYPNSQRASEAEKKYQQLLFEAKTKDKRLTSYESFLKNFPGTPYRDVVEQNIFEISTASGRVETFIEFIKRFPKSSWSKQARNIVWHLLKENRKPIPSEILNDSLRKLDAMNKEYLVPFYKDSKFGFINKQGEDIVPPIMDELLASYQCGNITEDILVTNNRLIARNGATVFSGEIQDFEDLGSGFLLVEGSNCFRVIHKSGFTMSDCIDEAQVLDNRWLALRNGKTWSLHSLNGKVILGSQWHEIDAQRDLVILRKGIYYYILKAHDLEKVADQGALNLGDAFVNVRFNSHGHLVVRKGSVLAILDKTLKPVIDWAEQTVDEFYNGYIVKKYPQTYFQFLNGKQSEPSQFTKFSKPWIALKKNDRWLLYDSQEGDKISGSFDSLLFKGPYCIAFAGDSALIYSNPTSTTLAYSTSQFQFIPGADSLYFLLVDYAGKKTILDANGDLMFTVSADKVEYAGEGYFSVMVKNKKGLIDSLGKVVLAIEFDALGNVSNRTIPVLKDKKFGLAGLQPYRLIKPVYEKNIVRYHEQKLVAFKDGKFGLIGWDSKPITPFEFDEIRFWNDTCMLVKKNFRWAYYNLVTKKLNLEEIKDFKVVRDDQIEKIYVIHQRNNYGVISNRRGIIIPSAFTLIKNLGSVEEPLYFAEKSVEEASVFVVVYYNEKGELLKRQVFEEDEYEKIICEN
ncbi:MAG: WG repeat-containing protein [Flammeovirgaceae bacterium]|nr:WG repeat-containing protein [Flammeovirgaceae bacterium]